MSIERINQMLDDIIHQTKDYEEFMRRELKPMLTTVGELQMERLHFYNLGYQAALEMVKAFIENLCGHPPERHNNDHSA